MKETLRNFGPITFLLFVICVEQISDLTYGVLMHTGKCRQTDFAVNADMAEKTIRAVRGKKSPSPDNTVNSPIKAAA